MRGFPFRAVAIAIPLVLLGLVSFRTTHAGSWSGRGHDESVVRGSGVLDTRTLDLEGFDSIRVDGIADIEVSIGDQYRVVLEAEDNLIDLIDARVSGNRLIIDMDDDSDISPEEEIHFSITMPALVEIEVEGVCTFVGRGLRNERTRIRVNGVATVELSGATERLDVRQNGVGSLELKDLVAQDARVRVDGIGKVVVRVEQELDAEADGMGSIVYYGEPGRVRGDAGTMSSVRPGH